MSDQTKGRKSCRIRLSTFIMITLIAASFIGINILQSDELYGYQKRNTIVDLIRINRRGWPLAYDLSIEFVEIPKSGIPHLQGMIQTEPEKPDFGFNVQPLYIAIPVNAITALLSLLCGGLLFEWLIRRREARKT
jgi:hypothetical protein